MIEILITANLILLAFWQTYTICNNILEARERKQTSERLRELSSSLSEKIKSCEFQQNEEVEESQDLPLENKKGRGRPKKSEKDDTK